jgi:diguanylate cyclase
VSADKDWKSKYYNSLDELEKMEKSWAELEDMLRKTISRVAITAKGINPRLDKILNNIQTHTRSKKDFELQQDLEDLSQALMSIEEKPEQKEKDLEIDTDLSGQANEIDFSLSLLEQLQLPPAQQDELEQLRHKVQGIAPDHCLVELAGFINQLLKIEAGDSNDKSTASEVLLSLIEKISFSYGNTPELENITHNIEQAGNTVDWRDFLDQIIKQVRVIIRGIRDEKIELEGLIVDVTRQLGEISSALNDDRQDSLQGRRETQQLQQVMDKSVQQIQQQVQSESDIQQLKSSIGQSLVSIKTSLKDFVTHDTERFEKAEKRNQKLQQQIQFMEQESQQLKKKLSENRQKLMYDSLTGVRNRLSYEELLEQELSRYSRYHEAFSYALLDIDHFKRINDEYGHNAGDKALQIVAQMMMKNIRKTDFLFRIGGEEFVLLLPKTALKLAAPLVEKIRTSVGQSNFHFKQQKVTISLSVGLTEMGKSDNAESIYERADKALYEAKHAGRDRLVVARSD